MVMRLVFVNMPMFARYAMQRTPLIHDEYNGLWRLSSVYGLSLSQYGAPHAIPGRSWTTTIVHESMMFGALRVLGCDGLVPGLKAVLVHVPSWGMRTPPRERGRVLCFVHAPNFTHYAMQQTPIVHAEYSDFRRLSSVHGLSQRLCGQHLDSLHGSLLLGALCAR